MILPLFYSVINSFKPIEELFLYPPRFYVMRPVFSNYTSLFRLINNLRVPFSRYAFNSVFVCVVITAGQILIASAAAYSLSKFKTRISWFFPVVVTSLLFNSTVLAIPQYIILNALGIVNTYWVYILPSLASSLGLFLMKQFMEQMVPDALIEAAQIDGAGHFRIFWQIMLPLVQPAIITVTIFNFMSVWNEFFMALIFTTSDSMTPVGVGLLQIVNAMKYSGQYGAMFAAVIIVFLPTFLLYLFLSEKIIVGATSGGVKG